MARDLAKEGDHPLIRLFVECLDTGSAAAGSQMRRQPAESPLFPTLPLLRNQGGAGCLSPGGGV